MSSSRATAMQADGVRPAAPLPAAVVSLPKPDRAPHGAAEVVSVRAVLDRGERSARILGRVCGAARQGPVCLHPVDLPADGPGLSAWSQFCELLRAAALRRQVPLGEIATCIHSHHLPLRDFHGLTDAAFGEGDRFVFLDNLQMQCHRNERVAAVTADNWTYFWRDRHEAGRVMPVYGGHVRSACALLADEVAMTVAPGPGLLSPGHSAWLPVRTDLSALADERGEIDEDLLRSTVDAALTAAEQRFDSYRWPGRRRRADAYLNRRVALLVTGFGDLVERSGADPAGLPCLQAMQRLVRCIRQQLDQTSARLARRFGEVPALSRICPAASWFDGSHDRTWRTHFDAARRDAATRHRNLLAMSPYSVLPATKPASPDYIDLLPLIGAADAWSFAGVPQLPDWNVMHFKHFHRRARAVIQASHNVARIAAGV